MSTNNNSITGWGARYGYDLLSDSESNVITTESTRSRNIRNDPVQQNNQSRVAYGVNMTNTAAHRQNRTRVYANYKNKNTNQPRESIFEFKKCQQKEIIDKYSKGCANSRSVGATTIVAINAARTWPQAKECIEQLRKTPQRENDLFAKSKGIMDAYDVSIRACLKDGGDPKDAFEIVDKWMPQSGVVPTVTNLGSLMRVCDESEQWNQVINIYEQRLRDTGYVRDTGRVFDSNIFRLAMKAYTNLGQPGQAIQVFETDMSHASITPNDRPPHFEAMKAYSLVGRLDDALQQYKDISNSGGKLHGGHITTLLTACEHGKTPERADEVMKTMRNSNISANVSIYNALISVYATSGQSTKAFDAYKEMLWFNLCPNEITFVELMTACAYAGDADEAHRVFDELMPPEGIKPGAHAFGALMSAYERTGSLDGVLETWELMKTQGVSPTGSNFSILMKAFAKYGEWNDVFNVFDDYMSSVEFHPESRHFVEAISIFDKANRFEDVLDVYQRMREADRQPDIHAFHHVIYANKMLGKSDEIFDMYKNMGEIGLQPTTRTFTLLLLTCKDFGMPAWRAHEIYNHMRSAGVEPNTRIRGIMSAFSNNGRNA